MDYKKYKFKFTLNTWDRFIYVTPFNKFVGNNRVAALEELNLRINKSLNPPACVIK